MFEKSYPANCLGHALMATIGVVDINGAEAAYREFLGYECVSNVPISADYAALWGDENLDARPARLLRPKSGAPVFIRLVQADAVEQHGDGADFNRWFAIELCVQDSAKLYEQLLKSDYFKPFAPPAALSFSDKIFPFQCRGANGEILYLNETRGNLPDVDLPIAASFVDHIFIVILSASALENSTDFYRELLKVDLQESHEFPYKTINRVFDLPLETMHKLNTLGTNRNVFFEIDQTPGNAGEAAKAGGIHQGICCVSFRVAADQGRGLAFAQCQDAPYHGAKIAQTRGPDDERIELVVI